MRPLIEPYSPVVPGHGEKRKQDIAWPIASLIVAGVAALILWWLISEIVRGFNLGNLAFHDVYSFLTR